MIEEEGYDFKKTITMGEVRVLDICREIELMNEQLYLYFADLFSENREVTALWVKTANEEANHAKQFELAIKLKNEMLESVSMDAWVVDAASKYVRTLLESVKKSPPSLPDAVQLSIKLEEHLTKLHMDCIAIFTDETHRELFTAMMANDNRHLESLLDAQNKYSTATHP
jgi:rubrerythrin